MKTLYLFACSIAFVSMLGAQTGGSGSVEGQVLSSADGTPVRRAVVNMQRSSAIFATLPGQPPRQQAQPLQTETDEQGHFAFRDLEAGGYRIMVQRQGLVSQNSGAELWLGEGQRLTGYVVRATPQSVIAGKVTDENGDPVMGASVSAQRSGTTASGRVVTAGSAQSNDLGQFRIANLSAGDYLVAASYRDQSRMMYAGNQTLPDKPQFVYAATYHPSTAVAREAETVHVPDGGGVISGVDIKLVKTEGYSIRATVNDPGAPANGAVAYPNLRPRDPTTAPGGCCFGGMRQQDGSFLFTGVPPGSYVMTAQRNNPGTPGAAASANLPIEVRDRNLEGIILEVKPNADLQGAVRIEPQGACNASNMTVNLRPPGTNNGQVYGSIPQPAQVGSDLRFTLKNVAPGEYSVNVNGAMNRCYVKSVLYGGQSAPAGALTVGDGGSLEIVLGPYNAQLSVRAVDRDGNPVPGARITAVPKDAGAVNAQVGSRTSQGGQASMMSLRPGTYEVLAFENPDPSNAIYMPNPGGATGAYEGRGKTVTVGESGRSVVEVTVIPASETGAAAAPPPGAKGSLAGKVVNAVNGSPLAGVVVTLRGMFSQAVRASTPSMATDDQGRFAFADLAPGVYNVSAVEQRFVAASPGPLSGLTNQVVVGDGQQVAAYILKLAPAGVIAGTIKDEGGEPALGARVTACRYRNQMNQRRLVQAGSAVTDDLGAYRIVNLSAGEYYLSVQRAQPARGVANRSLISVQGALSEVSTWPGNGAQATPDSITGALPTEPETDYAPMWYPNAAPRSGATAVKLAVGATAGNIDMTWRRSRAVRIRGKVTDPSGSAVGTPVVILSEKGAEAQLSNIGSVMAARDGSFEISGVPAGSYWLTARPGPASEGGQAAFGTGPVGATKRAVQSIEVKDAAIEGIQLELSFGRTVRGSVKTDGAGPAIRPMFFSLTSMDGLGSVTINPGNDGMFTANGAFPGIYELNTQNLAANSYVKSLRYGGKDVPLTGFEFTGEGQLEIVLSNAAAILEGSITGADGKPAGLAGVVVAAASGPAPVRTGNADAAGNFYFANLPPGDYRVAAWDASTPEASDPPEVLAPYARYSKTVTLGASGHEKLPVTVVPAGR